jgi:phage anti-repressor protein
MRPICEHLVEEMQNDKHVLYINSVKQVAMRERKENEKERERMKGKQGSWK